MRSPPAIGDARNAERSSWAVEQNKTQFEQSHQNGNLGVRRMAGNESNTNEAHLWADDVERALDVAACNTGGNKANNEVSALEERKEKCSFAFEFVAVSAVDEEHAIEHALRHHGIAHSQ